MFAFICGHLRHLRIRPSVRNGAVAFAGSPRAISCRTYVLTASYSATTSPEGTSRPDSGHFSEKQTAMASAETRDFSFPAMT